MLYLHDEWQVITIFIPSESSTSVSSSSFVRGASLFSHSSQFQGLCLMKSSREMLQNLPYFWNMKTHVVFFHFSFHATLFFP